MVVVVATMATSASAAWAFGPKAEEGDPAFDACVAAVVRQIEAGLAAGGGPKSVDVGPANCDHYWQRTGRIGNGLPGSS